MINFRSLCLATAVIAACLHVVVAEELWVAKPLTSKGLFTPGIEGPNCDAAGNVLAVNFERQGTVGQVTPDGQGEVFLELPLGSSGKQSVGNGIVFDPNGTMYIADYVNHNVFRVEPGTKKLHTFAHDDRFAQPNDLAITPEGTLYCSDPDWAKGTGQLFYVDKTGKTTRVAEKLGTTNGIEVSPDGKTLYVNESVQRGVWAFPILAGGALGEPKLVKQFPDFGFDGMRADVDGNLWISRYGKGTACLLTPQGEILQEVDVLGKQPSNVCLGGPDGCTVYVTEVEHQRLVSFRVKRPGLAWSRWPKEQK
jgi:gluconolactonase